MPARNRPTSGTGSYKWIVLSMTTVGAFMTPLDGSIVGIALPSIASSLHIDFASLIWVPTAYLLFLTVLLLSFGRLSDIIGRKPLFVSGFTIFTVASALCGLSQNGTQLIIFRALQGASAALIGATSPAIVTDAFPSNERGKALGINAMGVYVGLSAGPPLGGFLVQTLGWRSIFYINVPIGIVVVTLSLAKLRESAISQHESFDLRGATTFSIGLATLLLALTPSGEYEWASPTILSLFVISGVSLALFVLIEKRTGEAAMFDLSLFIRNRLFAAANISALLNYMAYFGLGFFMAFYLQRVLGYSPAQAGLMMLPMPITMAVLSPISGWLSDRLGSRLLSSAGMGLVFIGLFLLSTLGLSSSPLDVLARLFIVGLGMGLFSSPNTSAVMGSVDKTRLGVASGTLATMRFMGQSLSLAVMSAVAATVVSPRLLSELFIGIAIQSNSVSAGAFVEGMRRAFTVSGFIAAAGVLTSLVRGKGR